MQIVGLLAVLVLLFFLRRITEAVGPTGMAVFAGLTFVAGWFLVLLVRKAHATPEREDAPDTNDDLPLALRPRRSLLQDRSFRRALRTTLASMAFGYVVLGIALVNYASPDPARDFYGLEKASPRHDPTKHDSVGGHHYRSRAERRSAVVVAIFRFFFSLHGLASIASGIVLALPFFWSWKGIPSSEGDGGPLAVGLGWAALAFVLWLFS
jgi:hypothetical protein